MGKAKKTRKFAVAKKIISPKDTRVKSVAAKAAEKKEKEAKKAEPRQVEQGVSALFFQYNTQLGEFSLALWCCRPAFPPLFHIIVRIMLTLSLIPPGWN